MGISLSSIKQQVQSRIGRVFRSVREHSILSVVLLVFIIPFLNEGWNLARVTYLVNYATQQGVRQAATGQYDSCTDKDCFSSDHELKNLAVENARMASILRIIHESLGDTTSNGSSLGATHIAVCSSNPSFYFDEKNNVCVPADNPGEADGLVLVSVGKDYVVGGSLGSGTVSLPIRAQQTMQVEGFRMTRSISVPPKILVAGGEKPITDLTPANPSPSDRVEPLVVVTGQLQLITKDVDKAAEEMTSIANTNGGYVAQSTLQFDGSRKSFNIQIRVPADKFEAAVNQTKKLSSKVLAEDINRQDVTEEYVDLESRLRSLQATSDQIKELLKKAQTIDAALKVNTELGIIQQQIEQATGRMKYLENRAQFATLSVVLSETAPEPVAPAFSWQPPKTVEKAWHFLLAIIYFTGDILIWAVIVGLPIGLVLWVIWKLVRRTWKPKS